MKILLLILTVLLISGCAHIKLSNTLLDGTIVEAEYTRWFNQNIEGFNLESPSGWKVSFDKQLSDFEIAFNLGVLSTKIGGK